MLDLNGLKVNFSLDVYDSFGGIRNAHNLVQELWKPAQ